MLLRLCTDPALIEVGGERVPLGRKALALLAYLTLEPGMHARQQLATLLWPEADEARAAMSLRQAVTKLRAALGERLHSDRQGIGLLSDHSPGRWRCDVTEFLAAVERDPLGATVVDVRAFLDPAPIDDAPEFSHWMDRTRAALARQARTALRRAARDAAARREWARAGEMAERWVAMDALSEEAVSVALEAAFMRRDIDRGRALFRAFQLTMRDAGTGEAHAPEAGAGVAALLRRLESASGVTPVHPVPAVAAPTPAATSARAFAVAMQGRDEAWATIASAWARVADSGETALALVQGAPGAGRSRLLADVAAWTASRGATVLAAGSHGVPVSLSYASIAELLRAALDAPALAGIDERHLLVLSQLQPELATRFPALRRSARTAAGSGPGPAFRWRVHEALTELLDALCEDAPLVLLLDDVTWCDRESATILQTLLQGHVQRSRPNPVLWLASAPADESAEHAHALFHDLAQRAMPVALPGLSAGSICAMLAEFSGENDGWEPLSVRVHAVSHGVPALVCAALEQALADVGDHWAALRAATVRVPAPHPRLRRRIEALPDLAREILLGLSIEMEERQPGSCDEWHAGPSVSLDTLSHVHGISRLRAARVGALLVEGGLATESPDGFRPVSPAVAGHMLGTGSSLVADELRRVRRLFYKRA